jgi:hypothetical protein
MSDQTDSNKNFDKLMKFHEKYLEIDAKLQICIKNKNYSGYQNIVDNFKKILKQGEKMMVNCADCIQPLILLIKKKIKLISKKTSKKPIYLFIYKSLI